MQAYVWPAVLLIISNAFMTAAWYGHLKYPKTSMIAVVVISWGIAFFEYCFQVPANRIGHQAGTSAGQLKVMQEVITLVVFVLFARWWLGEKLTWNYYVAFALILGAVYFVFAFGEKKGPQIARIEQRSVESVQPVDESNATPRH